MNKKTWKQDLFKRYPMLFGQKDWDMKKTCMCWGIDAGYGWAGILDKTCGYLMDWWEEFKDTEDYKETNKKFPWEPQFVQIKEKFGQLRIYMNCDGVKEVSRILNDAETASSYICEWCGSTHDITTEGGWLLTLCPKCKKERYKRRPFRWLQSQYYAKKWKVKRWLSQRKKSKSDT